MRSGYKQVIIKGDHLQVIAVIKPSFSPLKSLFQKRFSLEYSLQSFHQNILLGLPDHAELFNLPESFHPFSDSSGSSFFGFSDQVKFLKESPEGVKFQSIGATPRWKICLVGTGDCQEMNADYLIVDGSMMSVGDKALPSPTKILMAQGGGWVEVISELSLDTYLLGVLSSEMPLHWPFEALKAQAVAARSYVLSSMKKRAQENFDVDGDENDQVFNFLNQEEKRPERTAKYYKIRKILTETQGLTLFQKNSKELLRAFYHADAAGETTTPEEVWGEGYNSGVVRESLVEKSPYNQWEFRIDIPMFDLKMGLYFGFPKEIKVKKLIFKKSKEGRRISKVKIIFSDGGERELQGNDFRRLLGFRNLKSTYFNLTVEKRTFVFRGKGFGHGVGMSQWGCRQMAEEGASFKEILLHYYNQARLGTDSYSDK